jgi:hypothetical protein
VSSLFEDRRLLHVGQEGEQIAASFFAWTGWGTPEDVRADPFWQRQEVDYRLHLKAGDVTTVEVKSDQHIGRSGNVLFELLRIHHTSEATPAYLGWSVFSAARWLLVWCPPTGRLYLIAMRELRRGFQAYTLATRPNARLSVVSTDTARTTINVLVPLGYVNHQVYCRIGEGWVKER